ncbi:Peptidyl-tRNA hydrolase [hydrothermal vent metagenome]|uniref:peptidyl-tRNA hydrolase n=1 Tax=hydrothermal vent metagenome TaxID=652676 RepID=A0A1W1C0T2_9ZZZZ
MLLVGLGNPGPKYSLTRHNVGFMVIGQLINELDANRLASSSFNGELYKADTNYLLKPLTYMNLSGESVVKVADYFKIDTEDIIVVHDDLDLPFGSLRFKRDGGHGGHNGLKSIDAHVGKEYIRIRIGIGKPERKTEVASYVLSDFNQEEQKHLQKIIIQASDAAKELLKGETLEKVTSLYSIKKPNF